MVRRLCIFVALCVLIATQALAGLRWHPNGELAPRPDGTFKYVVSEHDRVGQWQVAFGDVQLWSELVAANPQLANPDLVRPGDELNVPPSLVKLFRIIAETDATSGVEPANPPVEAASAAAMGSTAGASASTSWNPWLALGLMALALFLAIALRVKTKHHEALLAQVRESESRARRRRQRIRQNPYAGPPVVAGGLPTGHRAADFLVDTYRRRFPNPQGDAQTVRLLRVEPRWYAGNNIRVGYAGDVTRRRDILRDQPGWRGVFSDATVIDVLERCANGLYSEVGGQLADDHTDLREGLPVLEPNRLVWPELAGKTKASQGEASAGATAPAQTASRQMTAEQGRGITAPIPPDVMQAMPVLQGDMIVIAGPHLVYKGLADGGFSVLTLADAGLSVRRGEDGVIRLVQGDSQILLSAQQSLNGTHRTATAAPALDSL